MGSAWRITGYTAAALHQMGIMPDSEVLDHSSGNEWAKDIRSISLESSVVADCTAIRIECPTCVPQVASHVNNTGGYVWVSFRGDEKYSALKLPVQYQNKVYVHLARAHSSELYGKGTELWAILDQQAREKSI